MFMLETPSFDMTTQQAVGLLCCLEETRREANRLPKNKRRSVWVKRCGARHTSPHGFLKLLSHVLTIKKLNRVNGLRALCTRKQRCLYVSPFIRSIQEGLLLRSGI